MPFPRESSEKMKQETTVVVVGAGPAGIATSACLNLMSIPHIILERENCCASLWKDRSYDRLKLHLAKQFCQLPHMPFPPNAPTFIPKNGFIEYLDDYVSTFGIKPLFQRSVESASFDKGLGKWLVVVKNLESNVTEEYVGIFVVVASGENSVGSIPRVLGLDTFEGSFIHSSEYMNGKKYGGKNVLVVGSGNSGMEIAYDLSNWGAKTSIVVRSAVHVLTKEMGQLAMNLLRYLPVNFVDNSMVMLAKLKYGDLASYGLRRPTNGPFYLKMETGRSPIIDVGTVQKIRSGDIKVLPSITKIKGNEIEFDNGQKNKFDAIVFATGYRTNVKKWLKDEGALFNEEGLPKQRVPNHWKGENGIYCVGFARAGLFGISNDAKNIANDISKILSYGKNDF